ncbi:ABC transporter ATP-binding protein [Anaerocolumna sp. AGMB13025]|uniref:ABC transporter ATP-binding protein n=1 Tax=Anaerocolumna sp. AGMB13025 TaxID=3039116 RepID=UPI00241FB1F8|nr:ABC transporter ATP-binding protein [Anaerocolumna sp. AGMB13025]WFR57891.1 ABC transporter ATP-binding protein [Anaerocolumna sp. AGMB13025]
MKKIWPVVKWIAEKIRTFLVALILIIILSAVLSLCRVAMAVLTKGLIDAAVDGDLQKAVKTGIYFTAAIIIQIILKGAVSLLSVRTQESMSNRIRYRLYRKLIRAKWMEYAGYHSGDIVTRLTSDVNVVVSAIVSEIPEIISQSVGLVASFIALFVFDPVLAVFAFLLGPAAILMSLLFGKKYMKIHERAQAAESAYRSYLQESMEHMLVLKTFCQENESGKQVYRLQENKKRLVVRKNLATVIAGSLAAFCFYLVYLAAFLWSAVRLFRGSITFGTLTAFLQLITQIQVPFLGLSSALPQVLAMTGSARRLMELEELEGEVYKEIDDTDLTEVEELNDIVFEQVTFSYKENYPVLKNITAKVYAGEIIGLIGTSGEGKTTLIHLLMQLLEPSQGRIYFHYEEKSSDKSERVAIADKIKTGKNTMRSLISYVPQGNTLFSGTIAYNLKIGNQAATEEEQIAALKGADAWEFVKELSEGLNTVIGERGLGLSEGQAQRISIARALLRNTPILLLDEATSSLDIDTEKKVLTAVMSQNPKRTLIIITHRPSILDYCHRVWRLTDGKLSEVEQASKAQAT